MRVNGKCGDAGDRMRRSINEEAIHGSPLKKARDVDQRDWSINI
jgi:hypothetical protein